MHPIVVPHHSSVYAILIIICTFLTQCRPHKSQTFRLQGSWSGNSWFSSWCILQGVKQQKIIFNSTIEQTELKETLGMIVEFFFWLDHMCERTYRDECCSVARVQQSTDMMLWRRFASPTGWNRRTQRNAYKIILYV